MTTDHDGLLPSVSPASQGHSADHAALKIDYDKRHPDEPLPTLPNRFGRTHEEIHSLLAADYNINNGGDLPTEVTAWTLGHSDAHNVLHTAYNARQRASDVD